MHHTFMISSCRHKGEYIIIPFERLQYSEVGEVEIWGRASGSNCLDDSQSCQVLELPLVRLEAKELVGENVVVELEAVALVGQNVVAGLEAMALVGQNVVAGLDGEGLQG